ncbi:MAG: Tad domain-containing protein [Candidatus Binatia bacterium]
MQSVKNERGSVLIFATLIIVLLLVMVGMGLDTGRLAYVRSQGQPAVDSAALAAASAIPSGDMTKVTDQAAKFNPGAAGNPGAGNNYIDSSNNKIGPNNVTLVKYNNVTGTFITSGVSIDPKAPLSVRANGVRVALENNNPHGGTAGAAMQSPLFLTPLLNLLGHTTSNTADVSVNAVAVLRALPGLPITITDNLCLNPTVTKELDMQSKNSAGWETYYIENASTSEIRALWEALPFCSGQPIVDVGYCGNVSNGVNETIVNGHLKPMFKAEPDRCYLIPVMKPPPGQVNQCQTITDWASFCPDKIDPFPKTGVLKGTLTCGQNTWESRDTKCYVPFLIRDAKSGM